MTNTGSALRLETATDCLRVGRGDGQANLLAQQGGARPGVLRHELAAPVALAAPEAPADPVFVIQYLDAERRYRQITSLQAEAVRYGARLLRPEEAGACSAVMATYRRLAGLDLDVTVTVRAGTAAESPSPFRGLPAGRSPCTTAPGCASPMCSSHMSCSVTTWVARRAARRCCGPMVRASCSTHRSHRTWPPTTRTPGRCARRTATRGTIPATRWPNCRPTTTTARACTWPATTRRATSSSFARCTTARGCDWAWPMWAIGRTDGDRSAGLRCGAGHLPGRLDGMQRTCTAPGACNSPGRSARCHARQDVPGWLLDSPPHIVVRIQGELDIGPAEPNEAFLPYRKIVPLLDALAKQAGYARGAGDHVLGAPRPVDLSRLLSPGGGERVAARVLRHGAGARLARGHLLQRHALGDGALLERL